MASTKSTKTNKTAVKEVQEAKQTVSSKNIVIALAVVVLLIVVGIYIYKWRQVKNDEKLMNSYLITSGAINLEIKDLDEVTQILSEAPTEYFVLITYTGNEDTYNLETGIKDIIDKYNLGDAFYYINVSNLMEEDNYMARINNAFNTDKIKTIPIILYYRDGEIVDTVTRVDKHVINAGDFQHLLDIYYEGR